MIKCHLMKKSGEKHLTPNKGIKRKKKKKKKRGKKKSNVKQRNQLLFLRGEKITIPNWRPEACEL